MNNADLTQLMFALVSLIGAAHGFGYAFERFRLPRVGGEILGGLLLGPSVLGVIAPGAQEALFPAAGPNGAGLSVLYWLGLIMLMFVSGFRIQRTLSKDESSVIGLVLVSATALPLLAGWYAVDVFGLTEHMGFRPHNTAFHMVIAIAVAVTSIPVISRIFMDLGILDTQFARIVLAVSMLQDILLWIGLSMALALAEEGVMNLDTLVYTASTTLAFIGISLWLGPGLLRILNGLRFNLVLKASRSGYLIAICFLFAGIGSFLDINAVFGALVAGIVVGRLPEEQFGSVRQGISDLALGFFVPIYFALVGLKIDLPSHFDATLFLGFLVLSSTLQIGSVITATRLARYDWLSSLNLAIAMNTRGGPGIVLASVAYEFGLVDSALFVTLVLTAIVTSIAAGAWFRLVLERSYPLLVKPTR